MSSRCLKKHLHPTWLEQLEHIVLSVSLADNADARMGMVHQQLKKAVPTQTFSDFVPGLETRLYTKVLPKIEAMEEI